MCLFLLFVFLLFLFWVFLVCLLVAVVVGFSFLVGLDGTFLNFMERKTNTLFTMS